MSEVKIWMLKVLLGASVAPRFFQQIGLRNVCVCVYIHIQIHARLWLHTYTETHILEIMGAYPVLI